MYIHPWYHMDVELKIKIIKHYGENSIKEGVRMQISYELDYRDAARFTLYRSLENADVKRRKTVLRWMVAIMLLASIPAFQLKHPAAISGKKQHSYPYEEITHFLYFKKLLLLTLHDGSSILIPRHAFNSNHDYKAFYMHILNHCPQ